MVRGISTRPAKPAPPVDPVAREEKIQRKMSKLAAAIKIPAPINQFNTTLSPSDEERLVNFLAKYRPETKEEKVARLSSADPNAGPRPMILKFGMKHLTDLIEQKRLRLVVMAADVTPITVIVWLPTLCKKMGISYAIVKKQETLGKLVGLKRTAALGLENSRDSDRAEFDEILRISDAMFLEQYQEHMKRTGGMIHQKKAIETE